MKKVRCVIVGFITTLCLAGTALNAVADENADSIQGAVADGVSGAGRNGKDSAAIDYILGNRERVVSKTQREEASLRWWPDGNIGLAWKNGHRTYYAANGSAPVRTTGPLDDIAQTPTAVTVTDRLEEYPYLAGGPVYRDPGSGRLLLFYHAEIWPGGNAQTFQSALGLAISTDEQELTFRDLGVFLATNNTDDPVEMCGAPFIVRDGYFYVYFRDSLASGGENNLAVARAAVDAVVEAALEGNSVEWKKYYEGSWTEPGLRGLSSPLETGNPQTRWMSVSYNDYADKIVMIVAQNVSGPDVNLFMTWSDDGIQWEPRIQLETGSGESFYPSIVPVGSEPSVSGWLFYVYYTYSEAGSWDRWSDAIVVRRKLTFCVNDRDCDGLPDDLENTLGTDPLVTDTDHDGVSDYEEVYWDGNGDLDAYNPTTNPTGTDLDPLNPDTDGDGVRDGFEVRFGSNPLDPDDTVALPIKGWATALLMILFAGLASGLIGFQRLVRAVRR